jgi:hypothetical protein
VILFRIRIRGSLCDSGRVFGLRSRLHACWFARSQAVEGWRSGELVKVEASDSRKMCLYRATTRVRHSRDDVDRFLWFG